MAVNLPFFVANAIVKPKNKPIEKMIITLLK